MEPREPTGKRFILDTKNWETLEQMSKILPPTQWWCCTYSPEGIPTPGFYVDMQATPYEGLNIIAEDGIEAWWTVLPGGRGHVVYSLPGEFQYPLTRFRVITKQPCLLGQRSGSRLAPNIDPRLMTEALKRHLDKTQPHTGTLHCNCQVDNLQ